MELWIRSQDKEILVKANNLSIVLEQDDTCEIINTFEEHQCWELGTYKSKERALEVLDEIQNILLLKDMYVNDKEETMESWKKFSDEEIELMRKNITIYEMPQK